MTQALLLTLLAAGKVAGTASYAGPAPKPAKISKTDVACKLDLRDPSVTVSKSGKALANVVVRVTAGAPPVEVPAEPVTVTQKDCMYEPRVQGAVKGQRVVVKNGDITMHNVHAYAGLDDKKTLFNVAQPPGAKDVDKDSKETLGVVRMKCDVHPWMRAYVLFNENRFFTVTDAEGAFALDLPPGQYTLEAWHETLGVLSAEVKVEDGKSIDPAFVFKP